ncbi:MAG: hypothetical protein ACJAYE_002237 [Candidatus Azotimanducaceae bacterium]|jgi:hypothetical protein
MEIATLLRCTVIFMVLATTFSANMADNLMARLGIEQSYGYAMGLALMFSLMLTERNAFIIAAVVMLSLNANMPAEFSLNMGLDRDYYAGIMLALLFQPVMVRTMQLE